MDLKQYHSGILNSLYYKMLNITAFLRLRERIVTLWINISQGEVIASQKIFVRNKTGFDILLRIKHL